MALITKAELNRDGSTALKSQACLTQKIYSFLCAQGFDNSAAQELSKYLAIDFASSNTDRLPPGNQQAPVPRKGITAA